MNEEPRIPPPSEELPFSRPRPLWRRAMNWIIGLALVVLVGGWMLARFEAHQLYYPTPLSGQTPGDWGLPFEDVRIATADGETLHAWWLAQPTPDAPLLIFFHGNAGNRADRLDNVAGLWRHGIAVLIFDYRGYGGSSGVPSEKGLQADGEAVFDWLAAKEPGRPIVLFGRSLGGAVAAGVARTRPLDRLILESTFTSAPEMAKQIFPIPGIDRLVRSRFDTLAAVAEISRPLLLIHGKLDELVPFSMGRSLYQASASAEKTFREVPGGHHNDTYLLAGEAYWDWIGEFLGVPDRSPEREGN